METPRQFLLLSLLLLTLDYEQAANGWIIQKNIYLYIFIQIHQKKQK